MPEKFKIGHYPPTFRIAETTNETVHFCADVLRTCPIANDQ